MYFLRESTSSHKSARKINGLEPSNPEIAHS